MENPYKPPSQSDYSQGYRAGYNDGFDIAFKRYTALDDWAIILCYAAGAVVSFIVNGLVREKMPMYDAYGFLVSALILPLAIAAKNAPVWVVKTLSEKK